MTKTAQTDRTAFLFPGQGAQQTGMGKDICEKLTGASDLFDRAEKATGLPLRKLCFQGPDEELARTDIAQPAIFTVSAAILAAMEKLLSPQQLQANRPAYMAGLSLGEYTALYAAGSVDFETGVRLVARRGELMQQAAVAVPSGMVSVLGLDEHKARELCEAARNGQILSLANFNCPGQIVLSGEIDACRRVEKMAKSFGATAAIPLKVAGAFHSEIMAPAAKKFAEVLDAVRFAEPESPVVSNVDAKCYAGAHEIRGKLLAQLTSPVRWQQSMELMLAGSVGRFLEIGPGKVLRGLLRRINKNADCTCVNSADALENLKKTDIGNFVARNQSPGKRSANG
jgi:[acyl-carrier-protein] S-malonyltransferase